MRFRRNSLISPVFLVLLLMLILGAVAGQLVGKGLRILEEERHMDIYMTALRDYSSRLLASARNTLEAANNSPSRYVPRRILPISASSSLPPITSRISGVCAMTSLSARRF